MKHVSTQVATKAPAKKHSTYAAFRVDPTFNFANFSVEHKVPQSPSTSNFSRPLSIRPAFSSDDPDPKAVFVLPQLSRQSSFTSSWRDSGHSTAPSTSQPETPAQLPVRPVILSSDDSMHVDAGRSLAAMEPSKFADRMSFMMLGSSKSQELDLSFPVERLFQDHITRPRSSSLHWNSSRPGTANGPNDVQKDASKEAPKATESNPALELLQSPKDTRFEEPRSAPPIATSFSDFRQALAERQESQKAASLKSGPPSPALPFLQQDPFKCPIHGEKRQRPKSAGLGASPLSQETDTTGGIDFDAPVKKQGAPSIMSTKSTKSVRSIKKGFSRFKRILKGPLNEDN